MMFADGHSNVADFILLPFLVSLARLLRTAGTAFGIFGSEIGSVILFPVGVVFSLFSPLPRS